MMSTIGILVMNMSGKIIHTTTEQYRKEQAILLSKSYTELAILAVMSNDRTVNCVENINGDIGDIANGGYQVRATISYIGNASANLGTCGTNLSTAVITPSSPLNIIVDTYIRYKELDNLTTNWITYHRRTLQKI